MQSERNGVGAYLGLENGQHTYSTQLLRKIDLRQNCAVPMPIGMFISPGELSPGNPNGKPVINRSVKYDTQTKPG